MKDIRPIETRYHGYRMRSRLEARWGVFFDAMDAKWEYEPEGYKLSSGECYLPDFLIGGSVLFEIKPPAYRFAQECEKWAAVAAGAGRDLVVVFGLPEYESPCLLFSAVYHEIPATIAALGADELNDWLAQVGGYPYPEHFGRVATVLFSDDPKSPRRKFGAGYRFDNAVDAAKGARFEHGEHGDAA